MSTLDTIDLFSLKIVNASREATLDGLLAPGGPRTAAFINAHCVNTAASDASYRWALGKADYLLPDGVGLEIAARLKGGRLVENLNGTDLFPPLCRAAAAHGLPIYFLGSHNGVARAASEAALRLAPGLTVAGTRHGYFTAKQEADLIAEINASGAEIVLVALGVPRQEVWIARNRHRLSARLVLGVGAQLDFWSGRVPRAPGWIRHVRGEWIWRLMVEPRRLARRYLIGNPAFMLRALLAPSLADAEAQGVPARRLLDLVVACSALALLAPLFAAVGLAIMLDSPGPVLFRQVRVGRDGRPFTILKFRSMYADAERRRDEVLAKSDRSGVCFKAKADPRITPVGRWLRRFSLDELPQLFNVLAGDMGLVGPRPALPQEVAVYPDGAQDRLEGKPGLTGLWQVAGRAEIGFARMVEMDRAYVRSNSVALDLMLILLTARAILTGRGAF